MKACVILGALLHECKCTHGKWQFDYKADPNCFSCPSVNGHFLNKTQYSMWHFQQMAIARGSGDSSIRIWDVQTGKGGTTARMAVSVTA
jgi:hypothetical protein